MAMKKKPCFYVFILLISICFGAVQPVFAEARPGLSGGQMIYVPVYSHIYSGDREKPFKLTVTLSIRNVDPKHAISITSIDYYESQGKFLKKYIDTAMNLKPLGALRYIVPESDKTGGSGANFLVEWKSEQPVNAPIVESVMIGTQSQQGISFTSRGRVIVK
jgi:Protein of unknown function (DUF3124)